jgi:hypothetical protein
MPDGTVFSGSIHRLKDQQEGMAVGCLVHPLQRAQFLNVVFQQFLVMLLRLVNGIDFGWPLLEVDLVSLPHAKVLRMDLHHLPSGGVGLVAVQVRGVVLWFIGSLGGLWRQSG